MKGIHLPCLRGNIGDWVYFTSIMRIEDIVKDNRIITVSESTSLYTKNINDVLQRELNLSRVSKISKYLLNSHERFFSSLIVAIHKGDPKWSDFDIERQFRIENNLINDEDISFIENKLGVLTLSGNEEIFVLDGQHRLKGLREALSKNLNIGNEEISVIFIIHSEKLKERTRRLFTVLNRYAQQPKKAEWIILEEDDAAAILTRRLLEKHPVFLKDNSLSDSNAPNLAPNDFKSFTTLVSLYDINLCLLGLKKADLTHRPNDATLDTYYEKIVEFWDFFFKKFPEVLKFIDGENVILNEKIFNRNSDTGGSLLLRPIGQKLFVEIYRECEIKGDKELKKFKETIRKIDFDLDGVIWKYIFWNGTMIKSSQRLRKNIFRYLLGMNINIIDLKAELTKQYKEFNIEYEDHIKPI